MEDSSTGRGKADAQAALTSTYATRTYLPLAFSWLSSHLCANIQWEMAGQAEPAPGAVGRGGAPTAGQHVGWQELASSKIMHQQ